MNNQKEIKLSSNWTNLGLYGGSFVVLLIMIPVLYFMTKEEEFHLEMMLVGFAFLTLIGFLVYQFIYICDARIVNDTIVLKKQFRTSKSYTFDRIGRSSSYQLEKAKYITVEMKNNDNSTEKYLIVNSKPLLSFENKDVEQVLISLRNRTCEKQQPQLL